MSSNSTSAWTGDSGSFVPPPPDYPFNSEGSASTDGTCYSYMLINGVVLIVDYQLIPLCLWALYIGVSKFLYFRKCKETEFYSIIYLMYGCMMTSAMIADCFSQTPVMPEAVIYIAALVDVGLTSTIATFFLYGGLASLGYIDPSSTRCKLAIGFNTFFIFSAWTYDFLQGGIGPLGFFLYDGIVSISGLTYLILQFEYLKKNNALSNLKYLFLGGLCGATGILSIALESLWCQVLGGSPNFFWFFISDVTMLVLAIYINKTKPTSQDKYQKLSTV